MKRCGVCLDVVELMRRKAPIGRVFRCNTCGRLFAGTVRGQKALDAILRARSVAEGCQGPECVSRWPS